MKLSLLVLFSALACAAAQKSIPLAPFPDMSAPRAVTSGPHDHFLANYFAINAWSPDNRYLLALETDIKDKLPDGAPCTLGLVDLEDDHVVGDVVDDADVEQGQVVQLSVTEV